MKNGIQFRNLCYLIAVCVALLSCGENRTDKTSVPEQPTPRHFIPPEISQLSEQQIINYIEIRRREKQLLEINQQSAPGISRHYEDIEKQAALESNLSIEEYLWIKNIIINTGTQAMLDGYFELNNKIIKLLEKTLARRKKTRELTEDPEEAKIIDAHINEINQQLHELKQAINKYSNNSDAMNNNLKLFEKHKTELESVAH